jgi:MipA family protein
VGFRDSSHSFDAIDKSGVHRMPIEAVMRAYCMMLGFLLTSRIAVGGALFIPELDRGLSNVGSPVPLVGSQRAYSYVSYADCGHSLFGGESWSVGPVVQDRLEGCKFADGCEFGGMADRRFSVDVGLGFSWETGFGSLSVSWVTNMLGRHKGFETEFAYALRVPWKGFDVIPSAGIRCKSSGLTDSFYGAQGAEGFSGQASSKAGSAIDPFVRMTVKKKLGGRLSMLSAVQCEWFDREIQDSPVVNRPYGASLLFGLLYKF